MTVKQVSVVLGLSERTVYQMVRDGRLPACRIGGRWRFPPEEIERWVRGGASLGGREAVAPVGGPSPGGTSSLLLDPETVEALVGSLSDPLERRLVFVALLGQACESLGWLAPVVVGGHAVEFYTAGGYTTVDIDLASVHEPLERILPQWGFVALGRHWIHESLGLAVEAPTSHLDAGQREHATTVEVAGGTALVLGVEDVIADRLAACVHWRSEADCAWAAVLLDAYGQELDRAYLAQRAMALEVQERLSRLLGVDSDQTS